MQHDAKMKGDTYFGRCQISPPKIVGKRVWPLKKKARFQGVGTEIFTCGFLSVKEAKFQKSPLEVSLGLMIIIQFVRNIFVNQKYYEILSLASIFGTIK